jgi:hypothetical protein
VRLLRLGGIGALAISIMLAAYYATPLALAVISLGEICPYSPSGTSLCDKGGQSTTGTISAAERKRIERQFSGELCKKRGIRFTGKTADGAKVCFTLSHDGKQWLELGFTIVEASGCEADAGSISSEASPPGTVDPSGHFTDSDGNTATIRGAMARGVFVNSEVCPGMTFAWTARRAQ